jgi:hypothetical protein
MAPRFVAYGRWRTRRSLNSQRFGLVELRSLVRRDYSGRSALRALERFQRAPRRLTRFLSRHTFELGRLIMSNVLLSFAFLLAVSETVHTDASAIMLPQETKAVAPAVDVFPFISADQTPADVTPPDARGLRSVETSQTCACRHFCNCTQWSCENSECVSDLLMSGCFYVTPSQCDQCEC